MANKNHSLDGRISEAALAEFLDKGYEKASMRKIAANAGATVGAIYTRYATKDQLFCSLVQPLLERIGEAFTALKAEYYRGGVPDSPEDMVKAMEVESETIFHLLFDDHQRAVLLLCCSGGSSLESFFEQVVDRKIRETLAFFAQVGGPRPDEAVLRLFTSAQFHMYAQIIREDADPETAENLMRAAVTYHTGGWIALLHSAQQAEHEEA